MLKNTRFFAAKKYAFTFNYHFLYDLYAPIIGVDATNLYTKLTHEAEKQALTMGFATDINEFFKHANMNNLQFIKARAVLEALGLLMSYININNDAATYTFMTNEPLSFKKFIENQKFRHLLIRQIGQSNYERLEYLYGANRIPENAENVTATFDSIFHDDEINDVSLINFNELYERIAACTSMPIVIDKTCKSIVESYFKSYDLSISEIEHVIYSCIVVSDDHTYQVDVDLLRLNLNKLVNSANNINILHNIKLNRNTKMFIQYLDTAQLTNVFNDYMTLNSEQYLRAIVKSCLTPEHLSTIKILREKCTLSDYAINLLIDYTLFKTNGTLNEKYITKVANTVNGLGLKSLSQIYDHFHFVNTINQTASKTNIPESLVE